MYTREAVVAGQFYPGDRSSCIEEIEECLAERTVVGSLPETIVAGVVPHAGWMFSGSLAGLVFSAVRRQNEAVDAFVIFGAAHSYYGHTPAVYDRGCWRTPLGDIAIEADIAEAILSSGAAVSDRRAHGSEHSIEVQVPFIQHMFPDAAIVPIVVPGSANAVTLGEKVARIAGESTSRIVCIGSTDLTHYGPRYGFAPKGTGPDGIRWADEVNDRAFIESAVRLDTGAMLANAVDHLNACGPGAAAAAAAFAGKLGRTDGVLLAHTNSNEVMKAKMGRTSSDSVGYAAIVY